MFKSNQRIILKSENNFLIFPFKKNSVDTLRGLEIQNMQILVWKYYSLLFLFYWD